MKRTILNTDSIKTKILEGVNSLANLVKSTMGAKGRYILLKSKNYTVTATKDGVTVADAVFVTSDPVGIGYDLIQTAARTSVDKVGDGTTLTTVLTQSFLNYGNEAIEDGVNPVHLKQAMRKILEEVINFIKQSSHVVENVDTLINIATISANNDTALGKVIGETLWGSGTYGDIKVEQSHTGETYVSKQNGYVIPNGYSASNNNFISNSSIKYENCLVALYDKKITVLDEITDVIEFSIEKRQPIIIVAHSFEDSVLHLIQLNSQKGLPITVVSAPSGGDYRKEILKDLSVLSGGNLLPLDNISDSKGLGVFNFVNIKPNETSFFGGAGYQEDIQAHISELQLMLSTSENYRNINELEERLTKLTNGMSVLHVASETDIEQHEKLDRIEDAIKSTKAALKSGYVAGGGISLLKATELLASVTEEYYDIAADIFIDVLSDPFMAIIENAGMDIKVLESVMNGNCLDNPDGIKHECGCAYSTECPKGHECVDGKCVCKVDFVFDSELFGKILINDINYGYDVLQNRYGNMIEMGIIDPLEVVIVALRTAFSVAEIFYTTSGAIYEQEDF